MVLLVNLFNGTSIKIPERKKTRGMTFVIGCVYHFDTNTSHENEYTFFIRLLAACLHLQLSSCLLQVDSLSSHT